MIRVAASLGALLLALAASCSSSANRPTVPDVPPYVEPTGTATPTGPTRTATATETIAPTWTPTAVPIDVKDDPFWPNVQYEAPAIKDGDASAGDVYLYWLSAIRTRNNRLIIFRVHFANIYIAPTRKPRLWTRFRLLGGGALETESTTRDVSKCFGDDTCSFSELIKTQIPRRLLTGALRLKVYDNDGSSEKLLVFPAPYVAALVGAVEGKAR